MASKNIYRIFHLKAAEYTFFLSAHGTFSRIDHTVGHKANLIKFKKIKIISNISQTTISYKKRTAKKTQNTWLLNNMLLNNQQIPEVVKEEIKKDTWRQMNTKYNDPKPMEHSKSSSKREVYSNTSLHQDLRISSNKQFKLTPKELGERTNKTQNY